jgi:hypothetical protein
MYLLGVRLFDHGECEITSPKYIINQTMLDSSRSKLPVNIRHRLRILRCDLVCQQGINRGSGLLVLRYRLPCRKDVPKFTKIEEDYSS